MRIKKVWIGKYKHLEDFTMDFTDPERDSASLRFFIGKNGSGKSAFLEALGLIFTRVLQDETPGFPFELIYTIEVDGIETAVRITPNESNLLYRLRVAVTQNGQTRVLRGFFSDYPTLHPSRIIFSASGPTNIYDDILRLSTQEALISRIYGVRMNTKTDTELTGQRAQIDNALKNLQALHNDPRYLFVDETVAKLVLIALCAILPGKKYRGKTRQSFEDWYTGCRLEIMEVNGLFRPLSFSLVVDEENLKRVIQSAEKSKRLRPFLRLVLNKKELVEIQESVVVHDWLIVQSRPDTDNPQISKKVRVLTFHFMAPDYSECEYWVPKLGNLFEPIEFLSLLLIAKREGVLLDAHLAFWHRESHKILSESALSDGEYLWMSQMGVILLALGSEDKDTLFVFDEPDVHLNESWTVDFVNSINELVEINGAGYEFLIATHSTLILTDANRDQLYHFVEKQGKPARAEYDISPFGAYRDEISMQIFETSDSIGSFSKRKIEDLISRAQKELDTSKMIREVQVMIQEVGPGTMSFRLFDLLADLKQRHRTQKEGLADAAQDE